MITMVTGTVTTGDSGDGKRAEHVSGVPPTNLTNIALSIMA